MKQDAFSAGVEPGGLWHKNDIRILLCYILSSVISTFQMNIASCLIFILINKSMK